VIQDFEQTNDVSSTSVYFSRQGYFTFKFNAAPFLLLSAGFGGWFPLGVPYYVICPTPLTFVSSWSGIVGTAPNRTFVFQAQSREFDVPPGSGDTSGYAATLIYEVRFYEDDPRKVGIIVGNNGIVNAPNSVAPPGVYIDSPSTTAKRRAIFTTSTNVNGHAVVQNTSFTVTHVAWDAPGYNDGTQNTSAETIRLTVGKRATVGTDPVILGFGGTNFGARVSGDDLERTVFNIALRAKQGTNNTVSGVTIAAASSSDVVRVGQQYGLIRFSRDAQERISFDYSKTLPAGSNNTVVTATDVFRRVSIFRPRFEEELLALGEKDGNFSYLITQPRRETLLAEDSIIISNLLFRTLETVLQQGDLDPFGNINTMVSNGFLRMTDYVDIEYLDNDYVGESRSFS
jgi:hypothetical protein